MRVGADEDEAWAYKANKNNGCDQEETMARKRVHAYFLYRRSGTAKRWLGTPLFVTPILLLACFPGPLHTVVRRAWCCVYDQEF